MRFVQKMAVFVLASLLTVVGFNLMASSSVCLLKLGKESRYEIVANYIHEHNFAPCKVAKKESSQESARESDKASAFLAGTGSR
jgi:hypothetical protein